MGWVPRGGFGRPGTAAAPRVAGVWEAPVGRPGHHGSFWRWYSTPHSSAGSTLSGVDGSRVWEETDIIPSFTDRYSFHGLWGLILCLKVSHLSFKSQQASNSFLHLFIYLPQNSDNEARAWDESEFWSLKSLLVNFFHHLISIIRRLKGGYWSVTFLILAKFQHHLFQQLTAILPLTDRYKQQRTRHSQSVSG